MDALARWRFDVRVGGGITGAGVEASAAVSGPPS